MKERIQKTLGNAGVASRRNVEQMVLDGRIAVNGRTIRTLPILVDPGVDKIEVDGERIKIASEKAERRVYFLLNKPKGVYSTNVAQGVQVRAIDLLPPNLGARVYPVGQLDADSKGLLLLTNDGELTNELTHPRYGVAKTYRAIIDGYLQDEALDALHEGIWLADKSGKGFKTGRTRARIIKRMSDKTVLEITIKEGRNRQVRRMLAKLGHKVKDLTRIRMGPLTLEGISPGQYRELTPREVRALKKLPQKQQTRTDDDE